MPLQYIIFSVFKTLPIGYKNKMDRRLKMLKSN